MKRRRRALTASAGMAVVVVSGVLASSALASTVTSPSGQIQSVDVGHTSTDPGQPTVAEIDTSLYKEDGSKASPPTELDIGLPAGMVRNTGSFLTCDPNVLELEGIDGCDVGAIVGSGFGVFDARPVIGDPVAAELVAFNGTGGSLVLYIVPELSSPIIAVGTPVTAAGVTTLKYAIPAVPTLPGQPDATLTDLTLYLGIDDYLENPSTSCADGWSYGFGFAYENAETLSTSDSVPCTPIVLPPEFVTLTPADATVTVGTQHCVTATVEDPVVDPVAGIVVVFSVSGANTAGGSMSSDANGEARFCYTGLHAGADEVFAFADLDLNGDFGIDEPADVASVTYTAVPPAPPLAPPPAPPAPPQERISGKATCTVPKLHGLGLRRAKKKLHRAGCRFRIHGHGRVVSTSPRAGTRTTKAVDVKLKPKQHKRKRKRS